MQRSTLTAVLIALALGLLAVAAEAGSDEPAFDELTAELHDLEQCKRTLEEQRALLLESEVRSYLAHTQAQGILDDEGVEGVTIHARLTIISQATVGADPFDAQATGGDVDVDFDMELTDNLELFIAIGADTQGDFPAGFGPLAGPGGATLSGLFDGVGVNGAVSTSPGSARVYETGFRLAIPVGDRTLHVMTGKLDPRNYFLQNTFANDENTQFINNLFDDPPAITWPTNATGTTIYGVHFWMHAGPDDEYRIDVAFYNQPGQFFRHGQTFLQISWKGDVLDREMNLRVFGLIDGNTEDVSSSGGLSLDWWATETIGVFFRAAVHENLSIDKGETNHIESSWEVGAVFNALVPSRPDDQLGFAWGMIKGPVRVVLPGATENSEMVVELYYRIMLEEGKLQITPSAQIILDPGAGTFTEDTLVILGVRAFVPF